MSLVRAVGRNTLIQFGGKIVGTAIGLVTVAMMQRALDPSGFGSYTTVMAYLGFLSVVAALGLYLILVRELNRPDANEGKVVGNVLGLRWVSAAVILALGSALILVFPYPPEIERAVWIGSWSFLAIAATQLLNGVFQSRLRMSWSVSGELFGRAVLLAGVWVVVTNGATVAGIMTVSVMSSAATLIVTWIGAGRFVPLRPRFDWSYWRWLLHETWPVAISIVLNLIYFRIDTIFLSVFAPIHDVGLYGAAYKILEILNTFPIMFVGLLLPVLGRAFADHDPERFRRIFQKGFDLLVVAAVPLLIGGWILAEPVLIAIGGREYAPAAPVLRLLLIAVAALFLNSLSGHAVTMINRQRQMVWGYLSVAVVGVTLFLILIPRFSLYGAAVGSIVTQSLAALIGYVLVLRVMRFRLTLKIFWKIALAAFGMIIVGLLTRPLGLAIALPLTGGVYVLGLLLAKVITADTLKEIISNRPITPPTPPTA